MIRQRLSNRHGSRRSIVASAAVATALLVAGCGGGSSAPAQPGSSSAAPSASATGNPTKLTVSAAASLVVAFGTLQDQFEAANPGVDVVLNYGGSSGLAQQIVNGAPVDVFAAANTATMDTVAKAGLVAGTPQIFVTNKLEIAVAPGNPKHVNGFKDLARPDLKVVICAKQVPCGSSEKAVEAATGIAVKPVSEESDVTSVLSKVGSGDADAGVVYVTDVQSAPGKVDGVNFPEADKAINTYPIAVLKQSSQSALANKWVDFLRGADGQKVLQAAGFGSP
jgi:molybdate transport system substrate-binding protein